MLQKRKADGEAAFRIVALNRPQEAGDQQEIQSLTGPSTVCFAGSKLRLFGDVIRSMHSWADVVIFTHVGLASLLTIVPRARALTVSFIHGREVWHPLNFRTRTGIRRTKLLLTITKFTAERAKAVNPWLPTAECCHLGIPQVGPETANASTSDNLGLSHGPNDILIVGRLVKDEPGKGHLELIAAMQEISRHIPDARLIIAGMGSDLERYRGLAAQSPASDRIIFTGFVEQAALHSLFRNCALFAMPSRQDGFGLVYLEAMRAGKPCICSNIDGGQEVVVDGETGFHVDPDKPHALASAVVKLLRDVDLRVRLGEKGRQRFELYFTEEHFHDRFWDSLQRHLS